VTDVGERDVAAKLTQCAAEGERVSVVVGVVVRNDDLFHCDGLLVRFAIRKFDGMVPGSCH